MKKYNKITKEQIISLFKNKPKLNRTYIAKELGCSIYSVRQTIEDLKDQKIIKLTNYGYERDIN